MKWSIGNRKRDKTLLVCLACGAAGFALTYVFSVWCWQLVLIRDASMEPAYRDGQIVLMDKLHREFHRGDVIVFDAPDLGSRLIKRIAAEPGDVVVKDGTICYNDRQGAEKGKLPEGAVLLGQGEYYVLGDNAAQSIDSRDARVGIVSSEQIIGKVLR